MSLKSHSLTKLCSRLSLVLCPWLWNNKSWWSCLGGNNRQWVLEEDLNLKCGRFQRHLRRAIHGDFLCLPPLLVKQVLVVQAGASFWNGSRYFFRHMTTLKTNCSPFWHAVKMVLPGSLGLAKLLFSWSSAPHFPQRDANKNKFTMCHEFVSCSREKEATPSWSKGIHIQSSSGPNPKPT